MLTKEEARDIVAARLVADCRGVEGGCVIIDEHTIEKPWGWVFFYDSRRHAETGDEDWELVGAAGYIVNRHDGSVETAGSSRPIGHYIGQYEERLARASSTTSFPVLRSVKALFSVLRKSR